MSRCMRWLFVWGGPAIVVVQVATVAASDSAYRTWMRGELGLVENLTVAFLVGALVCALAAFRHCGQVRSRLFGPCLLVMAPGLFYFAGEEASWGQHWFGFTPPEEIAARNDQHEFNLHNDPFFEKFLDQLPRLVLSLGALGGAIAALVRRSRDPQRDWDDEEFWGWIWPTMECVPAAILASAITLPEKFFRRLDRPVPHVLDISPGETKEYCLGLFLLEYFWTLLLAVRAPSRATDYSVTSPA